jgi:hypothetical protein
MKVDRTKLPYLTVKNFEILALVMKKDLWVELCEFDSYIDIAQLKVTFFSQLYKVMLNFPVLYAN